MTDHVCCGCDAQEMGLRIADLERQLAERRSEAESALRALTPGCSEFQTITECQEFIRADRQHSRDVAVRFKRQADAAEERLRRVREIVKQASHPAVGGFDVILLLQRLRAASGEEGK